jgi:hypothetical protein
MFVSRVHFICIFIGFVQEEVYKNLIVNSVELYNSNQDITQFNVF